jgi:Ca-activated chloride channel family protein
MELLAESSGLAGLPTDVREFFAAVRLARPGALWLVLLLPVLVLFNWRAARARVRAVQTIGRRTAILGLMTHPGRGSWRWLGWAYPLGWLLLILGVAGPRWGKSEEPGVSIGRDLVIALDMSRSMRADDMSDPKVKTRWEAARTGAISLVRAAARRGGHRVAVVVFAAKPKLLCPLTTDYDYVLAILEDLDVNYPPPEIRPGADPNAVSGTRIGAGLIAAVQAHDEQFTGSQDIVLISDGDDPLQDREWLRGSSAAAAAHIPVHTVGVGGIATPAVLEIGIDGQDVVGTLLHEEPLKQIAEDTRGVYLPARRDTPNLAEFFQTRIEPNTTRAYTGDQIPQPKERYAWVLAPALLLLLAGWIRGR